MGTHIRRECSDYGMITRAEGNAEA